VTSRTALRTVVASCCGALLLVVLSPGSPALASTRDDGELPGEGLTALGTLLIFVVAPIAIFALITLLVVAPSLARGPRYRPGLGWWAAPVWFNGPDNADQAVWSAEPTSIREGGGSSARW
jgi:hypothetical protein